MVASARVFRRPSGDVASDVSGSARGRRASAGQSGSASGARGGRPQTLEALVASKEIVVVCGPGGVGKTTMAAAAAAMAALHQGGRVLVITVDPARRLADALGLVRAGDTPERVSPGAFEQAGITLRGELWASMLDSKESWDRLVARHAPDQATAKRILANPLYRDVSQRFVQSQDYIAVERLYELHSEGTFDLIVVDTPPAGNARDFLLAPERMADFFRSRLLRLLSVPYRSRLADVASRPFYRVADRILGTQFLEDLAEFFLLFQTMSDGFVARSRAVGRMLADRRTTFVVVSTLEAGPVREADSFIGQLSAQGLHLGGLVLNRVLPRYLLSERLEKTAGELLHRADELARTLTSEGAVLHGTDEGLLTRVLWEVGGNFANLGVVARREAAQRSELARSAGILTSAPELEEGVHDLEAVMELGGHIWS